MADIDLIMNMLDWSQPIETQSKGITLAKNVKCINSFILPRHNSCVKNVWDNCAIILSERSDQELVPYLDKLFEWFKDMNWPGATCIWDRLLSFENREIINIVLEQCIRFANNADTIWLGELEKFKIEYNSTI